MQGSLLVKIKLKRNCLHSFSSNACSALAVVRDACKLLKLSQELTCGDCNIIRASKFLINDGSIVRGACKIEYEVMWSNSYIGCSASK